jgi:hypothetical protein
MSAILTHCLKCRKELAAFHHDGVFCSGQCEREYDAALKSEVPPVSTRLSFGATVLIGGLIALAFLVMAGKNDLDSEQRTSLEARRAERLAAR